MIVSEILQKIMSSASVIPVSLSSIQTQTKLLQIERLSMSGKKKSNSGVPCPILKWTILEYMSRFHMIEVLLVWGLEDKRGLETVYAYLQPYQHRRQRVIGSRFHIQLSTIRRNVTQYQRCVCFGCFIFS